MSIFSDHYETRWTLSSDLQPSPYEKNGNILTAVFRAVTFLVTPHTPGLPAIADQPVVTVQKIVTPDMQAFTAAELLAMRADKSNLWRGLTADKIEAGIDLFRKAGALTPHEVYSNGEKPAASVLNFIAA